MTLPHADADALQHGDRVAGYVVEGVAGRGGMGVVYRARQRRPDRLVALKVLAPEFAREQGARARFERESELVAAIEHPNVIPVYEVGEHAGRLFIAMRLVDGPDLGALIAAGIEPALALRIVEQVAAALDAAHAVGLVHRDVKPANVLVADPRGRAHAYLSDFGIARAAHGTRLTADAGALIGTPDYLPPEQIEGGRIGPWTDQYALACVLHEALTGQVPFPVEGGFAKLHAHLRSPPPRPSAVRPELPRDLDAVVARGMAKDPAARHPSAGALATAALAAARGSGAARGVPRVRPLLAALWARRRPAGAAMLAVAAAVAGVIARPSAGPDRAGGRAQASLVGAAPVVGTPTRVAAWPNAIAASGDAVWVSHPKANAVTRLDARSGRPAGRPVRVGREPYGIAVGAGAVWVANYLDDTVTKLDPASGRRIGAPIRVGDGPADLAVGFGAVWVVNRIDGTLSRIDPATRSVSSAPVGFGPIDVAVGAGAVWTANYNGRTVTRVDPSTGRRAGPRIPVGERPESLAVGAGLVWAGLIDADAVVRIDPRRRRVVGSTPVGERPDDVVVTRAGVFVADRDAQSLVRLDSHTGRRTGSPVLVGEGPAALAAAGGRLWVANFDAGTVVPVRIGAGRE